MQKGNLLTLPVGGGLLYVQPIYISGRESGYPLLQAVVVSFGGNKIAWGKTLDSALDQLFGGNSGATAGDSGLGKPGTGTPTPAPSPSSGGGRTAGSDAQVRAALAEVDARFKAGQEALRKGDWTAYGKAQEELAKAIAKAMALQPQGGSIDAGRSAATPTPSSSSPGASGAPSPSTPAPTPAPSSAAATPTPSGTR